MSNSIKSYQVCVHFQQPIRHIPPALMQSFKQTKSFFFTLARRWKHPDSLSMLWICMDAVPKVFELFKENIARQHAEMCCEQVSRVSRPCVLSAWRGYRPRHQGAAQAAAKVLPRVNLPQDLQLCVSKCHSPLFAPFLPHGRCRDPSNQTIQTCWNIPCKTWIKTWSVPWKSHQNSLVVYGCSSHPSMVL